MPNKKLFDDESSDDTAESTENLSINKLYAENYEKWRRKEDYQKLKDKYGDAVLDSDSESDTSNDGDFAEPDNPEFDMDFFRVLAAIQLKHPILDEDRKFFRDSYQLKSTKTIKKEKPMTVKDYERKLILERGGKYDDDGEEEAGPSQKAKEHEMFTEEREKKFAFDDNLSDDDDDSLFTKKQKQKQEEKEDVNENEAVEFLKGKKKNLKNELDEELLNGLRKQWWINMSKEDKYLMDYFVNQRYLEDEDESKQREPNHYILDVESLEEDEETFNKMEEYETKYRFRFEEPDEDFIRRYPRVIDDTMRKKDAKRKEVRERKKTREEEEEERKAQEIKRLKAWKKKEILERIEKLKEVAGKEDLDFQGMDLDADFDPDQYDAAMTRMFDQNYYNEGDDETEKPVVDDEDLNRELQEEYEKLDQLDNMTEGNFRYMDVVPNNYGLTTEEVLCAKDTELNRWYSIKKMLRYDKEEEMERRDQKNYSHRASLDHIKKKILPSLYTNNIEDQWAAEEERKRRRNLKKKERRLRKNEKLQDETSVPTTSNQEQNVAPQEKASKKKTKKPENRDKSEVTEEPVETHDYEREKEKKYGDTETSLKGLEHNFDERRDKEGGNEITSINDKMQIGEDRREEKRKSNKLSVEVGSINFETTQQLSKRSKRKRENSEECKLFREKKRDFKKGNKNRENKLNGISDARLAAYGENPKKVRKLLKYSNKVK